MRGGRINNEKSMRGCVAGGRRLSSLPPRKKITEGREPSVMQREEKEGVLEVGRRDGHDLRSGRRHTGGVQEFIGDARNALRSPDGLARLFVLAGVVEIVRLLVKTLGGRGV